MAKLEITAWVCAPPPGHSLEPCLPARFRLAAHLETRRASMRSLKSNYIGSHLQAGQTRSSADADNRRDAFSGPSRSKNIVPFHILGIVSYCATVTLSSRTLFTIFDFKKCRDLEIRVRGHSMSLKVATFHRLCMVSYWRFLVTLSLKRV